MSAPYPSWVVDKTARAIYADTYPDAADTYEDFELVTERKLAIRQAYAAIGALQEAGYFATWTTTEQPPARGAFGQEDTR